VSLFTVSLFTVALCTVSLWLAPQADAQQNVVIVLDDSGSMGEHMRSDRRTRKIDAAKSALRTVLEQLPEDSQVGVVSLNGTADGWLLPLSQVDQSSIDTVLTRINARGGTPLGKFMKVAADTLLEARAKQHYGTYKLLIVTDGEATDPQLVDRYLPDIVARGLVVDVIGVDMSGNHSLSTKVQTYRRADDPASLTQAISQVVLGETSDADGDASEADFEFLAGLSNEVATAALLALSTSANEPIGERNAVPPLTSGQVAQAVPSRTPSPSASGRNATAPMPTGHRSDVVTWMSMFFGICCIGFVAVVLLIGVGVVLVVKK
jgi:uncharacterized protein YegL